ncbi:RdgB/HAM1 family non-canonical purine NTP pyrophosphatase, partial [Candidatus Woesebacteria bacterium]|nr:RdgB/HAM1 family non-canonical purine NTP pyrophosphatase [Candidatus Woesebacteria bacterium]
LKAQYYSKHSGLPCLADDLGLEVDALEKRPGIYSARYIEGSDADRSNKILQELEGVMDRQARFVCALAYVPLHGEPSTFRGSCEGSIGFEITGSQGFGYDPIFIPTGYTQSFGELGSDIKNTLSHRHKAMEAFSSWYRKQL